jgi:hypothetical protein
MQWLRILVLFLVFSKTNYIEIEISRLLPNLYLFIVTIFSCHFVPCIPLLQYPKPPLNQMFVRKGTEPYPPLPSPPLSLSLSSSDLMHFLFQSADLMLLEAILPFGLVSHPKNCEITVELLTPLLRFVKSPHSNQKTTALKCLAILNSRSENVVIEFRATTASSHIIIRRCIFSD